jgi:hypothetical protein
MFVPVCCRRQAAYISFPGFCRTNFASSRVVPLDSSGYRIFNDDRDAANKLKSNIANQANKKAFPWDMCVYV